MKARIVIEVPDAFLERRARLANKAFPGLAPDDGRSYLLGRLQDIADDELRIALLGWPATITVEAGSAVTVGGP